MDHHTPVGEHHRRVAEVEHGLQVVADEDHRTALRDPLLDSLEALLLESEIADREHLVDDQDLGLEVGRDREREPHLHATRVALHRRVDECPMSANSTISSNLRCDLRALHAEDRAVQKDVLAAGQLGMEAGADLEQRADPPAEPRPALRSAA